MSNTLNPTITITVSGPTGSGKSRVLAVIADVLKLIHSDCIIEAPDVKAEKEMCGNDYTAWHKPRSGTIFNLKEVNLPGSLQKPSIRGMSHSEVMARFEEYGFRDKVGHPLTLNLDFRELLYLALDHQGKPDSEITFDDLVDRTVPVHIQPLMNKLGISFEEGTETDLQGVIDLANWANAARAGVGYIPPDYPLDSAAINTSGLAHSAVCSQNYATRQSIIKLVDQQLKGSIDSVTARAAWYNVTGADDIASVANHLTFALNYAVNRSHHNIMERGINSNGIPTASSGQEHQAENISYIYSSVISQLYGKTDMIRAHKFWLKTLEEMRDNKVLLVEILIQVIADINNQQDTAE